MTDESALIDFGRRLDAMEIRIGGAEHLVSERGPVIEQLRSDVQSLRKRYHRMANQVMPLTLVSSSLLELPRRMTQFEERVASLADLPRKFDEFKADFLVFKGKITGGLVFAGIAAPVLTGTITASLVYFLTHR